MTRAVARLLADVSTALRVVFGRVAAIRDAGVCGPVCGASALAPREPPHWPLVRWVAGASLRGGDPGHDGVDVHAASAPGGFSAAAATGGTTHVVLLWLALNYWSTVNCNRPRWYCPGTRTQLLQGQRPTYVKSVVPSTEDWFPAGLVAVEVREPPVRMQPRRATDRLAPLAISLAACW